MVFLRKELNNNLLSMINFVSMCFKKDFNTKNSIYKNIVKPIREEMKSFDITNDEMIEGLGGKKVPFNTPNGKLYEAKFEDPESQQSYIEAIEEAENTTTTVDIEKVKISKEAYEIITEGYGASEMGSLEMELFYIVMEFFEIEKE
jgi:hypothetical protein